jgi:hypothetical protein
MTRTKLVPAKQRATDRGRNPRLPHERDESAEKSYSGPRKEMERAKRDLDAGLVDTDLRATPGIDAEQRRNLMKEHRKP